MELTITATSDAPASKEQVYLKSRMRTGFQWSFGATFIQGILQVAVTMTMARLLAPADYGLYAMVDVVLRWAGLMGQMGLSTVLVQKSELSTHELGAARFLSLGLAMVAAAVVAGGAPLIASAFGNLSIVPLLRVSSLAFLINGFGLTSIASLRRQLRFGSISAAELSGYILGNGLTAITLALHGMGVWSVVIGTLVGQLVQNVVAILQAKLPLVFNPTYAAVRPLLRQGLHVSVNTCLDVANNTMDTFVVARVMPQAILGLFNRAAMLAGLPSNFLWTAMSRVTFPSYSRLQHDPRTFAKFFLDTQAWSGTLCVAVPLGMIPAAGAIVTFLLGPTWLEAVPIVRLLLLGFAFDSLAFPYHSALDAMGRYHDRTKIRLVIILVRGGFLAAAAIYHRDWLFWAAGLAAASTWLISVRPVARHLQASPSKFFQNDSIVLAKAVACALAVEVAHLAAQSAHLRPTPDLLISALGGALALGFILRERLMLLRRQL